jgi:hypothetical protein
MRADGAELPSPMSVERGGSSLRLADSSIGVFIDPLSYHFDRDRLFDQHPYSDFHLPWVHVKELLEARGIPVHTADYLLEGDLVYDVNLYFAIGNVKNYKKLVGRDDVFLSGLFHIEAPIVHPTTYRETPEASRHFRRVFSFSSPEALAPFGCAGLSFDKFLIPEPYDGIDGEFDELWARGDRRFLCMISQNKLPTLSYKELYTERLRLLQHFAQTDSIDLYGIGWEQLPFRVGEPKSRVVRELVRVRRYIWERLPFTRNHPYQDVIKKVYRGPVESKHEAMSNYTFAICYENMVLEGWINEKIFDAFLVGTIPIYLGAPDVTDYIPKECFIDPRAFSDHAELEAHLRSLTEREIQEYRRNARAFMSSPQYRPFTRHAFGDLFVQAFEEDLASAARVQP